jgi:hypothetical protein
VDSEYREPSYRGVLITLGITVLAIGALVLLASYFLQETCDPGAGQGVECVSPSGAPAPGGDY